MGMAIGGRGGGYSHDPNVIPMIDILLVLLIIFMMTVVQARIAMDVQIPAEEEVEQEQQEEQQEDQIVLELRNDGTYAINNNPLQLSQLDQSIHALYDNRPAKIIFLKTARNRRYFEIITAMDIVRGAGVQVIGFTPPEEAASAGGS